MKKNHKPLLSIGVVTAAVGVLVTQSGGYETPLSAALSIAATYSAEQSAEGVIINPGEFTRVVCNGTGTFPLFQSDEAAQTLQRSYVWLEEAPPCIGVSDISQCPLNYWISDQQITYPDPTSPTIEIPSVSAILSNLSTVTEFTNGYAYNIMSAIPVLFTCAQGMACVLSVVTRSRYRAIMKRLTASLRRTAHSDWLSVAKI